MDKFRVTAKWVEIKQEGEKKADKRKLTGYMWCDGRASKHCGAPSW